MGRAPSLKPEILEYVAQRYLGGATPLDLVADLKSEFDIDVSAASLRQAISRRGLGRRRREIDANVCKMVPAKAAQKIAEARAEEPAQRIAGWVDQVGAVVDKTLAVATTSKRLKDVSIAMTTASTAIKTYRICAGLDRDSGAGSLASTFNFNFSNVPPMAVKVTPEPNHPGARAVEVSVTPVPDSPLVVP